ncbi:Alpha/Beta hydrolase protein [Aspergillus similis]
MAPLTPTTISSRPPYDPSLEESLRIKGAPEFNSIEQVRKHHTEYTIPPLNDQDSHQITLSVFRSKTGSRGPACPAVYYCHGGGQIAGNRFSAVGPVLKYFADVEIVFISVEYRLAPEHRAPAALEDSYAGLVWTADTATKLGIDLDRLMVMGVSGGAPMAAGCAILARDRQYPKLCAQMLVTPMLDDRNNTVSSRQFAKDGTWNGDMNRLAWNSVLGNDGPGRPDPSDPVVPARVSDLSGLPPTFLDVGDAEVFRDETVAYASVLWKCGVSTELHVWPGAFHGFDVIVPDALLSRTAIAIKQKWVKRIFGA